MVVRTALVAPRISADVVSRSRLNRHLSEIAKRRLTVVQAPAGFGKSTILQQWQTALAKSGKHTAWLSLDRHARDIMNHVIAALSAGLPEFQQQFSTHVSTDEFVTTDAELAGVVGTLSEIDSQVFLLIDDAHFLADEDQRVLSRLIERLPANTHMAIASREMPNLPLARLRAHGQLFEVGMNELRFTVDETRQLLASGQASDLSEGEIVNLVERTEGWAAGLRLASLTLAGGSSGAKLIASFSGSKNVIADFFSEDVFGSQPRDLQDFLLQTCLLERFSAELCDAVTGRSDSRDMIRRVEEAGLFLICLDDDRDWFRYHGLFAGFLSRRLADVDRDAVRRIHLAASRWYYENDFVTEALDHAVSSGSQEWLAELLEETSEEQVYLGKLSFMVKLAERLDRKLVIAYPRILLTASWLRIRNMQLEEARRLVELATIRIDAMKAEGLAPEKYRALMLMRNHREMMLWAALDEFAKAEERAAELMREPTDISPYIACTLAV